EEVVVNGPPPRSPSEAIAAASTVDTIELERLRNELDASLAREQELRASLTEQMETYSRELSLEQEVALRTNELDKRAAVLEDREAELEERERHIATRLEEFAAEHAELERLGEEIDAAKADAAEREQIVALKVRELKAADE